MDSKRNWINTISLVFFLPVFFGISTLSAAKAPSAKAPSNDVWAKSFNFETQKKYTNAIDVIKPLLPISPNNQFLLIRLGWLYYLDGQYNTSFSYYKKALELNSDSIDARLGLTLPLLAQQRWKESAIYAKEVIAISAWDYNAHIRLMTSESALLEWEALEKHASEMVKRYPTDPSAFIFLARAQAMQGKNSQAVVNYTLALERAPANVEALNFLKKH